MDALRGEVRLDQKTAVEAGVSGAQWILKGGVLLLLTFQNCSAPLLMRQSHSDTGVQWISQTGVIMQELAKLAFSSGLLILCGENFSAVITTRYELLRAGVPAACYLLQNN